MFRTQTTTKANGERLFLSLQKRFPLNQESLKSACLFYKYNPIQSTLQLTFLNSPLGGVNATAHLLKEINQTHYLLKMNILLA